MVCKIYIEKDEIVLNRETFKQKLNYRLSYRFWFKWPKSMSHSSDTMVQYTDPRIWGSLITVGFLHGTAPAIVTGVAPERWPRVIGEPPTIPCKKIYISCAAMP